MGNYKTYGLKLQLSTERKNYLHRLFNEAKWFYNALLSDGISSDKAKLKSVDVLNPLTSQLEKRDLTYLNSQMKQELVKRTFGSMKSIKNRKKGKGKLKFKSVINSIPLKNQTFRINNGRISFMGNHKLLFKAKGLHQLELADKIASGILVRKPSGYYLYITAEFAENKINKTHIAGIDFGIKKSFTISNGQILDKISLSETTRLKRIQRRIAKSKKASHNRKKLIHLLNIEYEKLNNKKTELTNQLLHQFKTVQVVIQDENLTGWKSGLFGKQVQHSILGTIKKRLISDGCIVVNRFERTSRTCSVCHNTLEFGMQCRTIQCDNCGTVMDRDVNAAINILKIGLDESDLKPLEIELDFSRFNNLLEHWSEKKETIT